MCFSAAASPCASIEYTGGESEMRAELSGGCNRVEPCGVKSCLFGGEVDARSGERMGG